MKSRFEIAGKDESLRGNKLCEQLTVDDNICR